MRFVIGFIFILFFCLAANAQDAKQDTTIQDTTIKTSIYVHNGDTTISTGFDTLNVRKTGTDTSSPDRVVGVKAIHNGESKYWLFFYFSTSDITQKAVKISTRNFAYLIKTNNEYIRLPYSGRAFNYTAKDDAGFFVDITNYLERLQSAPLKIIRFETSQLYHEIIVPKEKQMAVSDIINKLID